MKMQWYRIYHGLPYDPKLQVVAKRTGYPLGYVVPVWICVLDAASKNDPRGVAKLDPEEIAVTLQMEIEAVETILAAFIDKKLMDKDGTVVTWHKYQYATSTERSRKSRAAARRNKVQQDATGGNAAQRKNTKKRTDTDKDTERDSETDQITDSNTKNRTRTEKRECEREKQRSCGKEEKQTVTQNGEAEQ